MHEVWDEQKNWVALGLVELAYPQEFAPLIVRYAKKNKLEAALVKALVKQESSYQEDALSSAGALGLMQLMPPTAREVIRQFRVKNARVPQDILKPEMNLRLGSTYLKRMIRAFKGNIPFALAAYNVGIGNMRKWMSHREELKHLPAKKSSAAQDEIWFDELPWEETSFYVKAILRNLLIYRLLDRGPHAAPRPLWEPHL